MAVYERATTVDAPLDDVWEFHVTTGGLQALSPDWLHLRVEAVRGPRGTVDPDAYEQGTTLRLSMRPFGVGPRQRWTSEIAEMDREETRARFVDEMRDGPFRRWRHTHSFFAEDDRTVVRDRIEYETPLGDPLDALGWPGFEAIFRHRHRRTRELLGEAR